MLTSSPKPNYSPSLLLLAERRAKLGITLDEIEQATKISKRFLVAIEAGRYDELPGGIFTTSYIRQYAAVAQCDAEEILAEVRALNGPAPEEPSAPAKRPLAMVRSWERFISFG